MSYKLIVKPMAEKDITEAVDWYHTRATHLPERFLRKLTMPLNY
ncbi:hypothetical protein [Salegentibacter tibetensis]|nr:hypothetical protein [Salegentibacter tibetensis]